MSLDVKLQKLANEDWTTFVQILGEDGLMVVKARILRSEGKSWGEISVRLNMSPQTARTACKIKPVKN